MQPLLTRMAKTKSSYCSSHINAKPSLHLDSLQKIALNAIETGLSSDRQEMVLKYNADRRYLTIGGVRCLVAQSLIFSGMIGGGCDWDYLGDFINTDNKNFGTDLTKDTQELHCQYNDSERKVFVGARGYIDCNVFGYLTDVEELKPYFFVLCHKDQGRQKELLEKFTRCNFAFATLKNNG